MLTYAINPSGASGLRRLTALAALTALALPSAVAHAQNGLPAWIEPPEGSVRFGQSVASGADVDGDGINDIYVADPGYVTQIGQVGRWFVYSGATREIIWSVVGEDPMASDNGGQFRFPGAFIDDLDGDGLPDLLVGRSAALEKRGVVEVFRGATGERLLRIVGEQLSWYAGIDVARLGDLDQDGVDEFCYIRQGWIVICSGASGEQMDAVEVVNARRVRKVGDADGDGVAEFAVGQQLAPRVVHLFSGRTREVVWRVEAPGGISDREFGYGLASGWDLTGDGIEDVFTTGHRGGDGRQPRCYLLSGTTGEASLLLAENANTPFFSWVALGDLNGDGLAEPIAGISNDNVRDVRQVNIYRHPPSAGPIDDLVCKVDWRYSSGGGTGYAFGTEIAAADVTGDGCAEIILGSKDNVGVHIVGGSPMLLGHDAGTYAAFGERTVRRGFTRRFAAVGNAVGRPVRLAVSRRGNGCTFIPQLGICLDLDRPFQQIAQAITDADGFARFSIPIPADTTPGPVWMQCLDINFPRRGPSTSNVMRIEIVE